MKYISLTLIFPLMLKGCIGDREYDYRLKFINPSDKILYGAISLGDLKDAKDVNGYPIPKTFFIKGNSKDEIKGEAVNYWPDYVNSSDTDSINIFVIENDTYFQNEWDSICAKKLYTRAAFSLKQLEAINWKINLDSINKKNKKSSNL